MNKPHLIGNKHAAKEVVKDDYLHVRVDRTTKAKAQADAKKHGLSMSAWISKIINMQPPTK